MHIPGLSLAIVRAGRITKSQGYGFANLELSAHTIKETVMKSARNGHWFIEWQLRTSCIYGADARVPKHCDAQGILEMVRRTRRVRLLCFL
jgi:hypothetical protein